MLLKNIIWQEIQTALAATVFTVLVWIYAEGETIKVHDLTLDIRFDAPAGQVLVIRPVQPTTLAPVQVRVRCANAQWNEVQTWAAKPFVLEVKPDPNNPVQTVNLYDSLRTDARFVQRGVVVTDVRGDNPRLYVEATVTRALPVTLAAGNLELAGQSVCDPDKVAVTVPASGATGLETARLEAVLEGPEFDPTRLPEGAPLTREAPVRLAGAPGLKDVLLKPEKVKVTFTVRKGVEPAKVPTVPVSIVFLTPADTTRYIVQIAPEDQFLRDIELVGPRAVIERIRERMRNNEIPLRAYLTLSSEDLAQRVTSKTCEIIGLPPGVTLTAPVPLPAVPLKIIPRTPTSPAPGNIPGSPPSSPSPSGSGQGEGVLTPAPAPGLSPTPGVTPP